MVDQAPAPAGDPEAPGAPPAPDDGRAQHRRRHPLRELPLMVAVAVLVAFVVKTFVAQVFYIPSGSMIPQLEINDRVVVSKLAYRLHSPRRGDVVVFDAPGGHTPDNSPAPVRAAKAVLGAIGLSAPSTEEYIKRVIALPHERVEGRDGKVFVDDRQLVEPYLPPGDVTSDFGPVVVGAGQLWVMGDNRDNSADSRVFGTIPQSTIVGRAMARLWPPGRAAFL
ncbi:MAG TPA: signal peptidase I [Acidimicrobiales bacterium]|nr:signal peptidase I [Acidimicrobiales bacterium]